MPGVAVPSAEIYRKVTAVARRLGIAWPHNGLRHSLISYRIAQVRNAQQVALEVGNAPDIIFRHYRELASEEQAPEWFANPAECQRLMACGVATAARATTP